VTVAYVSPRKRRIETGRLLIAIVLATLRARTEFSFHRENSSINSSQKAT
jgi:hypothetical protein